MLARAVIITTNARATLAVVTYAALIAVRTFFAEASLVVTRFTITFSALCTFAAAGASFTLTIAGFYAIFALTFFSAFITFTAVLALNTVAGVSSRSGGLITATADSALFTLVAIFAFYTVTLVPVGVVGIKRFLTAEAMKVLASFTVGVSRFFTSRDFTAITTYIAFITVVTIRGVCASGGCATVTMRFTFVTVVTIRGICAWDMGTAITIIRALVAIRACFVFNTTAFCTALVVIITFFTIPAGPGLFAIISRASTRFATILLTIAIAAVSAAVLAS